MVFDGRRLPGKLGKILSKSRFSQVEVGIFFRKIPCYSCGYEGFYKYRVKQIRRNPEILTGRDEGVREDHEELWQSIPRYAEIPQTLRCKNCNEVLGVYTSCVY